MRIGEIAAQAEVSVQTIRFYEREGLLRKPLRTSGGYRSYEERDLERVRFIRVCQGLGFSLREVRELIRLHQAGTNSARIGDPSPKNVEQIVALAEERVASIDEKIAALTRMRAEMAAVIRVLTTAGSSRCPADARRLGSRSSSHEKSA